MLLPGRGPNAYDLLKHASISRPFNHVESPFLGIDSLGAGEYLSSATEAFLKSPYNIIDMLAVLPLPLRLAVAVPVVPSMEELPVAHFILVFGLKKQDF